MAHNVEPMDIDTLESDFDNKENSIHLSNIYPRTPCTEKGYEELDVSELNMKLRYSVTPASSPMSKSFTANCVDSQNLELKDDILNANLTRSYNSAIYKSDVFNKSVKTLPLQELSTEQLRPLDTTMVTNTNENVSRTVTEATNIDEHLSLPSSSSSVVHTPEVTTPTKDIPKDGGSPIMRGLKSVLNMFRSSQSPIPPSEGGDNVLKDVLSSDIMSQVDSVPKTVLASTPIASQKNRDGNLVKRNSPHRESIVFNEDLEKELLWKDETTILFSEEKIPIHKLFYQQTTNAMESGKGDTRQNLNIDDNLDLTVEYMDISYNESILKNRSVIEVRNGSQAHIVESDSEFVDCETTFTEDKSQMYDKANDLISEPLDKDQKLNETATNNEASVVGLSQLSNQSLKTSYIITQPDNTTIEKSNRKNVTTEIVSNTDTGELLASEVTLQNEYKLHESIQKESKHAETNTEFETQNEPLSHVNNMEIDRILHNNPSEITHLLQENKDIVHVTETLSVPVELSITSNDHSIEINTDTNCTFIKSQNDCSPEDKNIVQIFKKEVDSIDSPANVPLPDEDDIDNEKSLGVVIFEPLNTLPANMSVINNETMEIKLENAELIECLPNETTDQANFTNVNKTTKTRFTDHNNMTCLSVEESKAERDKMETVENELGHYKSDVSPQQIQTMKQEIAMDINEIIFNAEVQVLAAFKQMIPEENNVKMIHNSKFNAMLQKDEYVCEYNINMDNLDTCHSAILDDIAAVTDPASNVIDDDTNVLQQTEVAHTVTGDLTTKQISKIKLEEPQLFDNDEKLAQSNNKMYDENVLNSELNITSDIISDIDSLISETNDSVQSKTEIEIEAVQENLENKSNISYTDQIITQSQSCKPIQCKAENDNVSVHENEESNSKISYSDPSFAETIKSVQLKIENKIEAAQENFESKSNISEIEPLTETSELAKSQALNDKDPTLQNLHNKSEISIDPLMIQTSELIQPKIENEVGVTNENQEMKANIVDTDSIETSICEPFQSKAEIKPIQLITKCLLNISDNDSQISQTYECKAEKECKQEKPEGPLNISVVDSMKTCEPIIQTKFEKQSIEVLLPAIIKEINQVDSSDTDINNEQQIVTKDEIEINIDEEVLVSENNSPYVSVAGQLDCTITKQQIVNTEEKEASFAKTKTAVSPPISPKIISKGYNFNFDEMDDPFATKTKIRASPTPESPKAMVTESVPVRPLQKDVNKNRRKSQPDRKKPIPHRKKINNTFSGSVDISEEKCLKNTDTNQPLPNVLKYHIDASSAENITVNVSPEISEAQSMDEAFQKDTSCTKAQNINNVTQEKLITEDCGVENNTDENKLHDLITKQNVSEESKSTMQSIINTNEGKNTSSSEQSFYYSAGTSSGESIVDKNVFNIPEINDTNFNPFITKSKMRQTPTPPPKLEHTLNAKSNSIIDDFNKNTEDKICEPLDEKESVNISDTTCSSKTTDEKDVTVREVNTEDEDTVEGPFLEADLNNDDKMSDFDGEDVDMMQFSELPTQTNEENIDGGELFIDAETFEFLLNQNKSSVVSNSGKESLFLKFDPLFAKRVSTDGVLAALNKVQKRQSTPKKGSTAQRINATFNQSIPGPSTCNITQEIYANVTAEESSDDLNVTVSKPMMVVTPAVNPIVTPRNKTMTPTSSNRRSITFTSPAIAVIDRLLSLSGNNSIIGHDTSVTQVSREQNEADLALTQLRELLAEKEINVYNLRSETKELKDRLTTLESQMRTLETESEERLRKVNELNQKLSDKTKLNKSMAAVVEEYERTIASLIAETEQDKKRHDEERIKLVKERDEQTAHLASMEVSFSDLHSKYEKSKQIILTCKANEDAYKKSIKDFEENLSKMQSNYELLKQHATLKLNHANLELEKMNRAHEAEVLKLSAMIKRKDLHITSLEETLAQKTKANEELTAICDELINKVG